MLWTGPAEQGAGSPPEPGPGSVPIPEEAPETPRAQLVGDEFLQQKLVALRGPFPEVFLPILGAPILGAF